MTILALPRERQLPRRTVLPEGFTDVRPTDPDPLLAIARAADLAGFDALLVPFDVDGPDSLVTAAHLLRHTRHLRVYVGLEPWITTPQYAAKLSASLQRFSHGRLGWHFAVEDDDVRRFVATARAFWEADDGLPDHLSRHRFPAVLDRSVDPVIEVGAAGDVLLLRERIDDTEGDD